MIEEKAKKEEKVPVVQEKTVAPQVHSMTPAAKNSKRSDILGSIPYISHLYKVCQQMGQLETKNLPKRDKICQNFTFSMLKPA